MSNSKAEFICDLAETYGIHDYRKVPVHMLGTFAAGLGHNSRIGMKRRGVTAPADVILLAQIFELIVTIVWKLSGKKDAMPEMPLDEFIINERVPAKKEVKGYASGEDFEKERKEILEGLKNGN